MSADDIHVGAERADEQDVETVTTFEETNEPTDCVGFFGWIFGHDFWPYFGDGPWAQLCHRCGVKV